MVNKLQVKKITTHYTINVIMLVVLFLNLFPIAWMMYNSFKGNADIMSGKIDFKRADNNVIFLAHEKDGSVIAGTSDGALSKFSSKGELLAKYSLKSMSTAFYPEEDSIWIASSDKGLVKIRKSDMLKMLTVSLPIKALPTVELFKDKVFSQVVDVPHIGRVAVTGSDKFLWLAAESNNIRTIMQYDKETGLFSFIDVPEHFDFSIIKSLTFDKFNNYLWLGTDTVLIRHDLYNKGFDALNLNNNYLPSGAQNLLVISKSQVVFQTTNSLYKIDSRQNKCVTRYFVEDEMTSDKEFNSLSVFEDRAYLGTNSGVVQVDLITGKKLLYGVAFAKLIKGAQVDPVAVESTEIRAIDATKTSVLVGANYGRVSNYSNDFSTLMNKIQTSVGHFLEINSGWRNYIDMWPNVDFGRYLKNSVIICGFTMLIAMTLATMTAYALVRFRFPGVAIFSSSILITQMIPAILYLIPLFMLFNMIKDSTGIMIKGTYPGLIFIYSAWFLPFSIWILRGFFAAIPVELEEAATIDGCSNLGVFWRITLPLAIPGIIATGIFILIQAWDELMFAWMLTSESTQTIPVGIRLFVGNFQNRYDLMMAAATVATIPVLILFFILQKHIVRGLTAGAVKG